jgi:hypothetical protein
MPAVEGLAADHTAGMGPGAAPRHVEGHGTSAASRASRPIAPPAMAPEQRRGNRHVEVQMLGERLRMRRDHVLEAMLAGL